MNKMIRISLLLLGICLLARVANAQAGCVNSPENPTAVLALIGASGSTIPWLMSRLAKKRKK